jgi:hypothetical protein
MSSAYLPLSAIVLLRSLQQYSPSKYNSGGLPLVFLLYNITSLIEVMPHDNIASFCLAIP